MVGFGCSMVVVHVRCWAHCVGHMMAHLGSMVRHVYSSHSSDLRMRLTKLTGASLPEVGACSLRSLGDVISHLELEQHTIILGSILFWRSNILNAIALRSREDSIAA